MIKSFHGEELDRKEARRFGGLRVEKAQERLLVLEHATEKDLMALHSLHYHKLHGSGKYSIDANSRNSK